LASLGALLTTPGSEAQDEAEAEAAAQEENSERKQKMKAAAKKQEKKPRQRAEKPHQAAARSSKGKKKAGSELSEPGPSAAPAAESDAENFDLPVDDDGNAITPAKGKAKDKTPTVRAAKASVPEGQNAAAAERAAPVSPASALPANDTAVSSSLESRDLPTSSNDTPAAAGFAAPSRTAPAASPALFDGAPLLLTNLGSDDSMDTTPDRVRPLAAAFEHPPRGLKRKAPPSRSPSPTARSRSVAILAPHAESPAHPMPSAAGVLIVAISGLPSPARLVNPPAHVSQALGGPPDVHMEGPPSLALSSAMPAPALDGPPDVHMEGPPSPALSSAMPAPLAGSPARVMTPLLRIGTQSAARLESQSKPPLAP
jgi:hypothetical protein